MREPLRIGHVLASPFPALRGTQGYLAELLCAQVERGDEVHLWCYAGELGGRPPTGVQVHRAPRLPGVRSALRSRPGLARPVNDLGLLGKLLVDRAARRVQLFHGHNHEGGLAALLAGRVLRRPVVHQVHGNLQAELLAWADAGEARGLRPLAPVAGLAFDRWLPRAADACLRLRAPTLPGPGAVLPPGISPAEQQAPGLDRRLVQRALGPGEWIAYAGNLDPYQDLPRLFAAFRILRGRREAARLLLISHDPEPAQRSGVEASGLPAEAVRVVEAPDAAAAARWIAGAGLLVVPRTEPGGLPLKILNAIGLGVPVVTTRAAAAGLGEGEGVAVSGDAPAELAVALERLLERPTERQRLARAAVSFARSRPWSGVAEACAQTYLEVLEAHSEGGRRGRARPGGRLLDVA